MYTVWYDHYAKKYVKNIYCSEAYVNGGPFLFKVLFIVESMKNYGLVSYIGSPDWRMISNHKSINQSRPPIQQKGIPLHSVNICVIN